MSNEREGKTVFRCQYLRFEQKIANTTIKKKSFEIISFQNFEEILLRIEFIFLMNELQSFRESDIILLGILLYW